MYTYERLFKLCGEYSNDSVIAQYLLKNYDSLSQMKSKDIIDKAGVSKYLKLFNRASFYSS
ncbi:MAG: hypothetical protein LUG46_09370 [Erysipelotrichaceae bacterium]|nr:hypothetical protein [Erysipelotrichaceae bacterium]